MAIRNCAAECVILIQHWLCISLALQAAMDMYKVMSLELHEDCR